MNEKTEIELISEANTGSSCLSQSRGGFAVAVLKDHPKADCVNIGLDGLPEPRPDSIDFWNKWQNSAQGKAAMERYNTARKS